MDTKIQSYKRGLISQEYTKNNYIVLRYYNEQDNLILKRQYIGYWLKEAMKQFKQEIRNLK